MKHVQLRPGSSFSLCNAITSDPECPSILTASAFLEVPLAERCPLCEGRRAYAAQERGASDQPTAARSPNLSPDEWAALVQAEITLRAESAVLKIGDQRMAADALRRQADAVAKVLTLLKEPE